MKKLETTTNTATPRMSARRVATHLATGLALKGPAKKAGRAIDRATE
jgi:hypothetical protein